MDAKHFSQSRERTNDGRAVICAPRDAVVADGGAERIDLVRIARVFADVPQLIPVAAVALVLDLDGRS